MSNKEVTALVVTIVSVSYISIQSLMVFCLSIFGYIFVKQSLNASQLSQLQNTIINKPSSSLPPQNDEKKPKQDSKTDDNKNDNDKRNESELNGASAVTTNDNLQLSVITNPQTQGTQQANNVTNKKFLVSWFKIVWKLRSVYGSFAVHTFDILTDIIVIIKWWFEETNGNDTKHVDTRLMAWCSIGIILFHKTISSLAVWVKQGDLLRVILQFFDLLIFEEMYYAHQKVVSCYDDSNKSDKDIDSTITFKYIRSLEAIYESVPQAVLQLVYVMRTGTFDAIFIISILQSIISMTNSVLKDDNVRGMQGTKWKQYKKRLPPTLEFMKHGISRLSQVISRICILSLIWTVCHGLTFIIVGAIEIVIVLITFGCGKLFEIVDDNWNGIFLVLSNIVIVPPELMFEQQIDDDDMKNYACGPLRSKYYRENVGYAISRCVGCCFGHITCLIYGALLSWIMWCECNSTNFGYWFPSMRLGLSFMEITLIIIFGILDYINEENSNNYLFWKWEHSLSVFTLCIVTLLIDCSYLRLFPNFALPNGITARDRWGYAFSGELSELTKLKIESVDDNDIASYKRINGIDEQINLTFEQIKEIFWDSGTHGYGSVDKPLHMLEKFEEPEYRIGCVLYALANKHYEIVEWLETQGAKAHINKQTGYKKTFQEARYDISISFKGWID